MLYNALNSFLKSKFGKRVYKISIDIDSTCPNRDGSKGLGGCIYCNASSNSPLSHGKQKDISEQIQLGIEYMKKRHKAGGFISYFQRHSNTYGNTSELNKYYNQAINHKEVVGLAISTRPDCIGNDILKILEELNKKTFLWVELGLQSTDNKTLSFLNRGHTVEDFIDATNRLHTKGISVCAHVILGLPGETNEEITKLAKLINNLEVEGIKIHNLHILKNTTMENLYKKGEIKLLSLSEYAKRVVYLLERLNPKILIHRFNSHSPKELTIAPMWSVNKLATFNAVERELMEQNTMQGKYYHKGEETKNVVHG